MKLEQQPFNLRSHAHHLPSKNRAVDSLYSAHLSPMAAFKSVYAGSSSRRGTDIKAREPFNEAEPLGIVPLIVFEAESLRLKAAGSICMAVLGRARRRPKGGNFWHLRLHEEGPKGLSKPGRKKAYSHGRISRIDDENR